MQYRKVFVLTLALMLCALSSCTPGTTPTHKLTAEEAERANTIAHLLEGHKTVTYAQLDYIGGNTIHKTFYQDAAGNCCLTEEDTGYQIYSTNAGTFQHSKDGSRYFLYAQADRFLSDATLVVEDGAFTTQTVDQAGNFVCESIRNIDQAYADALSENWEVTTEDQMVTTTVFAPDDLRVLALDYVLRHPDGSESKIASGVVLYDQAVSHTDAVQDYLDKDKHRVTLKLPDGSVRVAAIPDGEPFTWYCDEGEGLYRDENGALPLPEEAEPVVGDLTLYCLPKK